MVALTLSGCEPTDQQPDDTGDAAQPQPTQGYSSSMGDNDAKSKMHRPENFTACPSNRPEMCTQQYDPACGYFYDHQGDDGKAFRTFGNHCTACQNTNVKGYVRGECPDEGG